MTKQFHIFVECPSCGSKMKMIPGAFYSPISKYIVCDNVECIDKGKAVFLDMVSGTGTYAESVLMEEKK